MRAVNLIPEELRPRVPGEGDPRVAYGVVGGLAVLLVMVLVAISYSNKLKTVEDQTAAVRAETQALQSSSVSLAVPPDEVGKEVRNRTLLVGGLAQMRFPWGTALYDLTRSMPEDVTLDSMIATSPSGGDAGEATPAPGAATNTTGSAATLSLVGCTSGWVGYSRFMTWLRTMPGVAGVTSNSAQVTPPSAADSENADAARKLNCGPAPLQFTLEVKYAPRAVDLVGLPKPEGGDGASGATGAGASAPTGVPTSATTPDGTGG